MACYTHNHDLKVEHDGECKGKMAECTGKKYHSWSCGNAHFFCTCKIDD